MSTRQFRFSEVSGAPNVPGIYSWYYRIELTDRDIKNCISDIFAAELPESREKIVEDFLSEYLFKYYKEVPYLVSISGKLKAKYEGHIDHHFSISQTMIRRICSDPEQLYELKSALKLAVPLFASPIYIGVATRLRERLMQHVRLIERLQHLRAAAARQIQPAPEQGTDEEISDHKFAYEACILRGFRSSSLVVNVLELSVTDSIRYDLENILNRINYPLCGRN